MFSSKRNFKANILILKRVFNYNGFTNLIHLPTSTSTAKADTIYSKEWTDLDCKMLTKHQFRIRNQRLSGTKR